MRADFSLEEATPPTGPAVIPLVTSLLALAVGGAAFYVSWKWNLGLVASILAMVLATRSRLAAFRAVDSNGHAPTAARIADLLGLAAIAVSFAGGIFGTFLAYLEWAGGNLEKPGFVVTAALFVVLIGVATIGRIVTGRAADRKRAQWKGAEPTRAGEGSV